MSQIQPEQQALLPQHRDAASVELTQHAIPRRPVPSRPERQSEQINDGRQLVNPTAEGTANAATEARIDSKGARPHISNAHWAPIWLSNIILASFIVLFAALAAALIVLWKVNRSEDGFPLTISQNPLAWKYGPTAILVVVVNLDYYCKIMQPWQQLQGAPSTAADSVMLDYLSPLNIKSFGRAVRLRHYPVIGSIAGFALLKVVILVSTGLLDLRPTVLERNYEIALTKTFDGSAFWNTVSGGLLYLTYGLPTYQNVSSYPVTANLGILKKSRDALPDPSEFMAFQTFDVPSEPAYRTVWADADVFFPNITCEIAETGFTTDDTSGTPEPRYQLRSNTCSTGPQDIESSICQQSFQDCPPSELVYAVGKLNCSGVPTTETPGEIPVDTYDELSVATPYDIRYVLLVMNTTYESGSNHPTRLTPVPQEISAVICKTDYFISKTKVSYASDTSAYTIDRIAHGEHLSNLSATMLGEIMWSALRFTNGLYSNASLSRKRAAVNDAGYSNVRDPLFQTVLRSLDGNQSMASLLSTEMLREGATRAYSAIASQLMKNSFLVPDRSRIIARGSYVDERLHIGLLSLWIMFAALMIVIFLALMIMLTLSKGCVLQDPGTIAAHALMLYSSTNLNQTLHSAGKLRTSQLGALLRRYRFTLSKKGALQQIDISQAPLSEALLQQPKKSKKGTWIPTAARNPMTAVTVGLPLTLIVILEILFQVSKSREGIADITGNEDTARCLSRYLSALTMLLVATTFSALDFTIASFAPFSLLRRGAIPANRAMRLNVLGTLPPVALVRSLKVRHVGSALFTIAAMTGSVLTIVSAGLWQPTAVLQDRAVTASLVDSFNTTWSNSAVTGDAGAVVTLDKVQHRSATMPTTIWNDIVMPQVSSVKLDVPDQQPAIAGSNSQNFTLGLESLLPDLTCEVLGDDSVSIEYTPSQDQVFGIITVTTNAAVSTECNSNGTLQYSVRELVQPPAQFTWLAGLLDLHTSTGTFGEGSESLDSTADNPSGCPSIGVIFAKTQEEATAKADVTALLCSQRIRQLTLDVTYSGGDPGSPLIKTSTAPVPRWNSARYLTNGTSGIDAFPYRVQKYLASASDADDGTGASGTLTIFNTNGEKQYLDQFFNQVVYGPNGTSLEDLSGRDNRQTLLRAVQALYKKYMSLVIDTKFRQPNPQNRVAQGTIDVAVTKLQMNETSKLVLQICLGAMTLLGIGTFLLADLRTTLPRNPCSIASTMGFLAGSDLCSAERRTLERPEGKADAAFEGWILSLGWWDQESIGTKAAAVTEGFGNDQSAKDSEATKRRFGIDVGLPAQLGFRGTRKLRVNWAFLRPKRR